MNTQIAVQFNLIILTFNLIIFAINDKIELTYDDIDAIL